ncbi:hypothetical protein KBD33_03030 [Candidatus Gracilibacteria bacterium]|nr:hypothetical protein [Candidatus Gracilibacteria bacterium]
MKSIFIYGNNISFNFSSPLEETGFLGEDFNYKKKTAYATTGIQDLIIADSPILLKLIVGTIFQAFYNEAQKNKLDYLQVLIINNIEVWCIDNGDSICILLKEEY